MFENVGLWAVFRYNRVVMVFCKSETKPMDFYYTENNKILMFFRWQLYNLEENNFKAFDYKIILF